MQTHLEAVCRQIKLLVVVFSRRREVFHVAIAALQRSIIGRVAISVFLAHVYLVKQRCNAIRHLILPCRQGRWFLIRFDEAACSKQKPKPLEPITQIQNSFFDEVKGFFNLLDLKGFSNA